MAAISKWLRVMLTSYKKTDCDNAYKSAAAYLSFNPQKLAKLDIIYANPSYYCGYVIRGLLGNLRSQGSVSSEQNHASIIAYAGNGNAGWSIMTHISQLMKRAQDHAKKRKQLDNRACVLSHKYSSIHDGQLGIDDALAKKNLSPYAYKQLYLPATQRSLFLQSKVEFVVDVNSLKEVRTVSIWPAGQDMNLHNCFVLSDGKPCTCRVKIDFHIQCCHELYADKCIMFAKWSNRWFHSHVFLERYPLLSHTSIPNNVARNDNDLHLHSPTQVEPATVVQNQYEHDDECVQDQYVTTNNSTNVGYQDLVNVFKELARCVQNNQSQCASVFADAKDWISFYQRGVDFEVKFINTNHLSRTIDGLGSNNELDNDPLPATT